VVRLPGWQPRIGTLAWVLAQRGGRQRAVLSVLCTVTLGPAIHGRLPGGAYLDTIPAAIQFTWHQ